MHFVWSLRKHIKHILSYKAADCLSGKPVVTIEVLKRPHGRNLCS